MNNRIPGSTVSLLVLALALGCGDGSTSPQPVEPSLALVTGRPGFGFNGTVSGFASGIVSLTGGGSYDPATASNTVPTDTRVASAGGFRCVAEVAQGPLTGCETGEGVRWDTVQLLASAGFKCSESDAQRSAVTDDGTVVLLADFYRAGDGNEESFTAQMIVSETDLAPDILGEQHLWIQGVGCGPAIVHFR